MLTKTPTELEVSAESRPPGPPDLAAPTPSGHDLSFSIARPASAGHGFNLALALDLYPITRLLTILYRYIKEMLKFPDE